MKLERVALERVAYRLRKPLRTHVAELRERRGWRVSLTGPNSERGLGEALPLPEFGSESHGACLPALERLAAGLHAHQLQHIKDQQT